MKITRFTTNLFQENCYLLWSEERKDAFVIDPGMMAEDERKCFDDFVLEIQCDEYYSEEEEYEYQ